MLRLSIFVVSLNWWFCYGFGVILTAVEADPWPGYDQVTTVDLSGYFVENLSGLTYQPETGTQPAILWAIQNYPPVLYKLQWNNSAWESDPSDGWVNGKSIRFPDGTGQPDAEDLTFAEWDSDLVYVCTERNAHDTTARFSVLLYTISGEGTTLNATMEWNLTADFTVINSNLGFEAITWLPDDFLVDNGFIDDNTLTAYTPSDYPNHGTGLLFLGFEPNGFIYAYALNTENGDHHRIAAFSSGADAIMSLSFDRDSGYLWSMCDDNCNGVHNVHSLDNSTGIFRHIASYERPTTMGGNYDTEGFTVTPDSECDDNGHKSVFWADDNADSNHSIRKDSIPCGQFVNLIALVDDDLKSADVWSDEKVSLVMMGVVLGGGLVVLAACFVHRHFHPPRVKPKTRLEPPRKQPSTPSTTAKLSKDGTKRSAGMSTTINPMVAGSDDNTGTGDDML